MLGRIDFVVAAGEHGHRAALDAGAMCRLIDATRQARGDDKSGVAEIVCQLACEFQPGARGVAGADNRYHRSFQHLIQAAHGQQRRCIVEHRKSRRITGFTRREQANADLLAGRKLCARVRLAANTPGTHGTAALRQTGQPLQHGVRAAIVIDQGTESARSDVVRTDQPQPVDPLCVGQVC
jgi:hypothetical protein